MKQENLVSSGLISVKLLPCPMVCLCIRRRNETSRRSLITREIQGYLLAPMFLLLPVIRDISDLPSQYLMNPRDPRAKNHEYEQDFSSVRPSSFPSYRRQQSLKR